MIKTNTAPGRARAQVIPSKTNSRFKQGQFIPKHPEKYVGRVDKIRYMSSYELEMHMFLDSNPNVLNWSSEEIVIPYVKPTDGKVHRYYIDYWVRYVDDNGEIKEELLEVKPKAQTRQPRKNHKHFLHEQVTYAVNLAKWEAAKKYADRNGMIFRIVTERSIYK